MSVYSNEKCNLGGQFATTIRLHYKFIFACFISSLDIKVPVLNLNKWLLHDKAKQMFSNSVPLLLMLNASLYLYKYFSSAPTIRNCSRHT